MREQRRPRGFSKPGDDLACRSLSMPGDALNHRAATHFSLLPTHSCLKPRLRTISMAISKACS